MPQVRLTKKSKYGSRNSVIEVTNNVAHSIVDGGFGKIYKSSSVYKHREMRVGKYKKRLMKTRRA